MKKSDSIKSIAAAIGAVQQAVDVLGKDESATVKSQRTNTSYTYTYVGLPTVWKVVKAAMKENNLAVVQGCEESEKHTLITTLIAHDSGEWIEFSSPIPLKDLSPQAVGSAITYGRRYGLMSALGLVADDDDDACKAQEELRKKGVEQALDEKIGPVPDQSDPEVRISDPLIDDKKRKKCPVCRVLAIEDANGEWYCMKKHWKSTKSKIIPIEEGQ